MNKSMKCIILIFAVIMIMVITGLGFCKGRNQEKFTKGQKIEKAENGEKTTKYVNNEVTKDKQTGIYYVKNVIDIFFDESISETCIFRKNRALAPHERSAVPLGTDHCPVC